jgi:magnesium chelatase subunit H
MLLCMAAPLQGNVGTAAYLNVFGSIFRVLKELKVQGYDVGDMPGSEGELIQSVLNNKEAKFNSADLNVAYRMNVRTLLWGRGCASA